MKKSILVTLFVIATGVLQAHASQSTASTCPGVVNPDVVLSHIVAMAENGVIGNDHNEMPWGHALKQDLKRFRTLTSEHIVIMGRKTFDSMYNSMGGRILPKRHSIVITRDTTKVLKDPNVTAVSSVEEAIAVAKTLTNRYPNEVFIVGGGEIFSKTQHLVKKVYLTVIKQKMAGAVHYPLVNPTEFDVINETNMNEAGFDYTFLDLERKNSPPVTDEK